MAGMRKLLAAGAFAGIAFTLTGCESGWTSYAPLQVHHGRHWWRPVGERSEHSSKPQPARAIRFALVSRAGTQPASNLRAWAVQCSQRSEGCGGAVSEGIGRVRAALISVVRPGEVVRLTLPSTTKARQLLWGGTARPLCRSGPIRALRLGNHGGRIQLPSGMYWLFMSYTSLEPRRLFFESGTLGILVSRTAPLRVIPAPKCR